ncbi:MAG TPA: rod shape-determining protein MreC [Ruminococcus sp.]|nr:rod shape-determining protein MreC [Ruminococcus sp.]
MREFFKSARFKVLLGFLALLVGIMIYAVTKGGYSVSAASFVNTVTKPFRIASNSVSMKIESIADKLSNADKYYEENQKLKAQIGELNKQLTEYDDLKEEVEELRKFVVIKEQHPDYIISQPAEVLGYIANDPFRSFTIDKGSAEGIEPFCPVVTAEGLVGITIDVSGHVSTVRTILSPDLSIAAVSSSTNADYGIIEGTVATAENGNTKLIHLDMDNELRVGDLMVTSGNSGLFPKGYAIGSVKSLGFETNGLSACAEIEPCSDITRLGSVVVITDFSGKNNEYGEENTESGEKEDSDEAENIP